MAESESRPLAEDALKSPRGVMGWRRRALVPLSSLENRDFRLLWLGMLGQAMAMWSDQLARSWLTWQLTGSATAIGLVNLFRAIPLITLGLVGGVVADRFDKRKVLIVIQVWSLGVHVAMAVLILGGWIHMWHVYVTAALMGGGMAMNQPVRTSFIPQLLEGRRLLNALSLNSIAVNVARLTAPAAVGFLIALANDNVGPAYVVASVMYTLVLVTTVAIHYSPTPSTRRRASMAKDFLEGFRYMVLENRTALALIVMAMGPLAFAFSYIVVLPVFVTEVLHMGASGFGTLQSVSAIGALAGGLTLASMSNVPHKGRVMLVTGLAYGITLMLLGGARWPLLAFALMIPIGASQTVFRTANNSTLLQITPSRLQGRVVSLTFLDMGVQSAAAVLVGAVTDAWNVTVGLSVLGIACIAIVGLIWIGVSSVRRL